MQRKGHRRALGPATRNHRPARYADAAESTTLADKVQRQQA